MVGVWLRLPGQNWPTQVAEVVPVPTEAGQGGLGGHHQPESQIQGRAPEFPPSQNLLLLVVAGKWQAPW